MDQYSDVKRSKVLRPVTTWMNFENIMLSESRSKGFIWDDHLYEMSAIGKSMETGTRLMVA